MTELLHDPRSKSRALTKTAIGNKLEKRTHRQYAKNFRTELQDLSYPFTDSLDNMDATNEQRRLISPLYGCAGWSVPSLFLFVVWYFLSKACERPASVAQLDAPSDWRPGGRGFYPRRGRQHSFVETDHEIFSTIILSLTLIQEWQLSISGERMCTILVSRLED